MVSTMITESRFIAEAATRECALSGASEIDEDHLLLALLSVGGPAAARMIRSGVDLRKSRSAALLRMQNLIEAMGIQSPHRETSDSTELNMKADTRWSPRAMAIMKAVPGQETDEALLEALLSSPTGASSEILDYCGVGSLLPAGDGVRSMPSGQGPVAHEQACPVSPSMLLEIDSSKITSLFPEIHGSSIQRMEGNKFQVIRTIGARRRVTEFSFLDEGVRTIRALDRSSKPTMWGKILRGPVRSSLRNHLRRQSIALIQSC